jgi:hypothetical protein
MRAALSTGVFGAGEGSIEFLRADLCRTDLLVEIEGVATI